MLRPTSPRARGLAVLLSSLAACTSAPIERVSLTTDGQQAEGGQVWGVQLARAADRYVAFDSSAENMVSGDNNFARDVFLRDRLAGTTTLISRTSSGGVGNGASTGPSVSSNGRFVAFTSVASDIDPTGFPLGSDVLVHNTWTGQTVGFGTTFGLSGSGTRRAVLSDDGQTVGFQWLSAPVDHLWIWEPATGLREQIDVSSEEVAGDRVGTGLALSADASVAAFVSHARNLVPFPPHDEGVYVRDRVSGTTVSACRASDGTPGDNSCSSLDLSADGQFVAFVAFSSNLVEDDTNGGYDVFVHDTATGATERVSVHSDGSEAVPAFGFGCDPQFGSSCTVGTTRPGISDDGRFVTYNAYSSNLVDDDTNGTWDVFVHDRTTHRTRRVSVDADGLQALGKSERPAISGDGTWIAFASSAHNLVPDDTNGDTDGFVRLNPFLESP